MTREVLAAKRRLRAEFSSAPRVEPAAARAAGVALVGAWLAEPRLSVCRRVALYAARDDEIPTRPLFDALCARGCRLLFPRCGERDLVFAHIDAWKQLEVGRYEIPAPPAARTGETLGVGDAVLVPGLAFDGEGHRLGRGGGWYDRSFPVGRPGPLLVGASFGDRLLTSVPHDSRDRGMDAIVTETGLRWVQGDT